MQNSSKITSSLDYSNIIDNFLSEHFSYDCEISEAAVRGAQTVYSSNSNEEKIKEYPINFSHFNINGHCFGAHGVRPIYEDANIYNVNIKKEYGVYNPIKITMPVMLPAINDLHCKDYFSGAAMAGVCCVIGEGSAIYDHNIEYENGKIVKFEMLGEIFEAFNKYYRGYGQIILQCNVEDDIQGLPEYAIKHFNAEAIEFKFGESSKGVQPAKLCKGGYKEALKKHSMGFIVRPDPSTNEMKQKFEEGCCPNFYVYDRLPLWNTKYMINRIKSLKNIGLKNIYFKMAGNDSNDIETVLRIASMSGVDMVTFDGADGGLGYNPNKTISKWGLPTICMDVKVADIVNKLEDEGLEMPAITISGGISTEDQLYKILALGEGTVTAVGVCRASMAAAIIGNKIGEMIKKDTIPEAYKGYGSTIPEIFTDLADLRYLYGKEADNFPTGAIGVFSYLNKLAFGLKHLAALNRKFDIELVDSSDVIPLTPMARDLVNGDWFDF